MVKWYKDLFLDGITRHTVSLIKNCVEQQKIQYPVFCVAFASNDKNLLDVLHVNELLFPYYKRRTTYILGLASSRQQAKIMAAAIVTKVYQETGDFAVREFFDFGEESKTTSL